MKAKADNILTATLLDVQVRKLERCMLKADECNLDLGGNAKAVKAWRSINYYHKVMKRGDLTKEQNYRLYTAMDQLCYIIDEATGENLCVTLNFK